MTLSFLSVCSGIEAASVAWEPLGFRAVGFSEIEAFPSAVLAARYGSNMPGEPLSANGIPNHGDFTAIDTSLIPAPLDLLVGGTPCQAFSIAGKRLSLADARGNLSLSFVVLAHGLARSHGLRNVVWENVPGVLSASDNAFGCFISAFVGGDDPILPPGGGSWPGAGMVSGPRARLAWRVLDAQYFGLAQRRRRVFLVADFGGGADPAAVLFERQGLRGHPPTRSESGQGAAADAARGAGIGGAFGGGALRRNSTDIECGVR
jgi:DNA (cytosine-5)-methyltransferase 1